MKTFAILISFVAVVGVSRADLRAELNASNRKVDEAMKVKKLQKVEALMKSGVTPDFKYVEGGKTQGFKTFIRNLTSSVAMMDAISSSRSRIVSLRENGNVGSARVEHTMVATMKTPDKKIHTTTWTGLFAEEYRKVGGSWKTSKMAPVSQKYLVDGKPAKM